MALCRECPTARRGDALLGDTDMRKPLQGFTAGLMVLAFGCSSSRLPSQDMPTSDNRGQFSEKETDVMQSSYELATFGNGCFWCTEAIFLRLKGVRSVVPGYSGGHVDNPTYEEVCSGTTGHAESVQISYDPAIVSFDDLLEVFWKTHDPTTRNRQGNDIGPQYRSVIFYHNQEQKRLSEAYREKLEAEGVWEDPIVTEIEPFADFWPAEDYHRNYYANNAAQGYCRVVIAPKVEKFEKVFRNRLQ